MHTFSKNGHLVSSPDGASSSFWTTGEIRRRLTIHKVICDGTPGLACNRWIRVNRDEWIRETRYEELFYPNISPSALIQRMHEGIDVKLAKMAEGFIRK